MSTPSRILDGLERRPSWLLITGGVVWTLAIGVLDWLTGTQLVLSVFYMLPVALAAWTGRRYAAVSSALFTAAVWYASDALAGGAWLTSVQLWNVVMRLAFLLFIVVVVASLHDVLREQHDLARRDAQTGLANAREFGERAQVELRRLQRTGAPLTLAYCDVDDLKTVNDTLGHDAGDRLLALVGRAMRASLRSTDTVARMGGDEFALLLPETADVAALAALTRVQAAVSEAIEDAGFDASLSVGATWSRLPVADVDALLRQADAALYDVKGAGKDGLLLSAAGVPADPAAILHTHTSSLTVRLS